eukprot:753777-Hanusia_phi.AAC.5
MVASSNSRVKSSGCQLLSNMLSDPVVSEIVLAEDSISSMTGAFLQLLLVDDIRIQSIAARVLWTLAEIPERRQKLIQQDALEYIVRMIGARHDELQSAAMQVLSKFLCHEPKLLEVVLNHPVLPITLVDLASFAQREDVVGRALSCIFYMCVRDEHAVKVCELGLLDALLVLVRRQEAVVITNSMMIIAALSHLADQMKYLVKEHIARDLIKIRESDVGRTVENLACAAIGMFIKNFEGRELVEVRTRLTQDNVLDYLLETLVEGYTQDHTIVYEGCKSLMYFAADDHLSSEYCARKALKDLLRISKGEREISRLSLRSYILRALPEETLSPEQRDERRSERPRHLEWQVDVPLPSSQSPSTIPSPSSVFLPVYLCSCRCNYLLAIPSLRQPEVLPLTLPTGHANHRRPHIRRRAGDCEIRPRARRAQRSHRPLPHGALQAEAGGSESCLYRMLALQVADPLAAARPIPTFSLPPPPPLLLPPPPPPSCPLVPRRCPAHVTLLFPSALQSSAMKITLSMLSVKLPTPRSSTSTSKSLSIRPLQRKQRRLLPLLALTGRMAAMRVLLRTTCCPTCTTLWTMRRSLRTLIQG